MLDVLNRLKKKYDSVELIFNEKDKVFYKIYKNNSVGLLYLYNGKIIRLLDCNYNRVDIELLKDNYYRISQDNTIGLIYIYKDTFKFIIDFADYSSIDYSSINVNLITDSLLHTIYHISCDKLYGLIYSYDDKIKWITELDKQSVGIEFVEGNWYWAFYIVRRGSLFGLIFLHWSGIKWICKLGKNRNFNVELLNEVSKTIRHYRIKQEELNGLLYVNEGKAQWIFKLQKNRVDLEVLLSKRNIHYLRVTQGNTIGLISENKNKIIWLIKIYFVNDEINIESDKRNTIKKLSKDLKSKFADSIVTSIIYNRLSSPLHDFNMLEFCKNQFKDIFSLPLYEEGVHTILDRIKREPKKEYKVICDYYSQVWNIKEQEIRKKAFEVKQSIIKKNLTGKEIIFIEWIK